MRWAICRLAESYRDHPRFRGLIIGGSVAKGYARDDSDVDFLSIATDEAFEDYRRARDLFINRRDLCDYEGGFVAYSHIPSIEDLLHRIPVYPEAGHDERVKAFYSMAFIQHWLFNEAERHGNRYTVTRAASQLALFAGRLILAHNRRLFPYHKWLPRTLELVPDKPTELMASFNALLDEPCGEHATALFELIRDFQDWDVSDLEAYTWFMTDIEWSWMDGRTPIEDW